MYPRHFCCKQQYGTCRDAGSAEVEPVTSSSTVSPFSLDSSEQTFLWDRDSSDWIHIQTSHTCTWEHIQHANAQCRSWKEPKFVENGEWAIHGPKRSSLTSRLWTVVCDWLREFCNSWRSASDDCTWDWSNDTWTETETAWVHLHSIPTMHVSYVSPFTFYLFVCVVGLYVQFFLQFLLCFQELTHLPSQLWQLSNIEQRIWNFKLKNPSGDLTSTHIPKVRTLGQLMGVKCQ